MLPTVHYLQSLFGHLDTILAACAALASDDGTADPHDRMRFEFQAIAHVLQIRHDMREVADGDGVLAKQLRLFIAVTDCFEDAASVRVLLRATPKHELMGGRIPIPTLVALVTAMRDALGIWYGVDEGVEGSDFVPAPIAEEQIWSTGPEVA